MTAVGRRLQVRLLELGAAGEQPLDEVTATILERLVQRPESGDLVGCVISVCVCVSRL